MFFFFFTTRSTPELKGPDDLILAVGMGASFLDVSVIAPTRKTAESALSADTVAGGGGGGGGKKKKSKAKGKSAQGMLVFGCFWKAIPLIFGGWFLVLFLFVAVVAV